MTADEKVDIEDGRKREILEFEQKLASPNHYEILGVPAGATVEEVTSAFREASKKFHPDRYFGKQLGSFKGRLEKIFRRLVEAHTVLTDLQKRQGWLEANPLIRAAVRARSGSSGIFSVAKEKSEDEKKRDAERQQRLARHPYLSKATRVFDQLGKAREAIAKGEYSQAFTFLNQASQFDPNNQEVKTLLVEVRRKNEQIRADAAFKAGEEALERQDDDGALTAFRSAVAASAAHHQAAYKAATLLERKGGDVREIISFAQKAVDAAPDNASYRLLLGLHMEAAGMKVLAKKHLEEAARLAPDDPEVKKHVKKRWAF
ncbi:MAG: DnaJ domain-containing protein [Myxococcales bacterium]|nr:DnaJ domain-containing protein [Myxococcales bacterium]